MIRATARRVFLDGKAIERAIGRRAAIALTRYGKIARSEARKEIKIAVPTAKSVGKAYRNLKSSDQRTRQRAAAAIDRMSQKSQRRSMPGGYPIARTRDKYATIRNIQYFYDRDRKGVVIGPIGFRKATRVPEKLEYGGTSKIYEVPAVRPVRTKGGLRWIDSKTGRYSSRMRSTAYRPASVKQARSTVGHRTRLVRIGQRPTMDLTYGRLRARKTLEQSIIYADRKLGGK